MSNQAIEPSNASSSSSAPVVVVGAGIIGLTTAIRLLERRPDLSCCIVAQHLPGDEMHIEYTSPWAGAHHLTHATAQTPHIAEIDKESLGVFYDEMKQGKTESIMEIDQYEYYFDGADNGSDPQGVALCQMPELRQLSSEELPEGVIRGLAFKTITINTPDYLVYLARRFQALGGRVIRSHLNALSDALTHPELGINGNAVKPRAIVNCTGLGALRLVDVKDQDMFPTRGQLCIIRAPWIKYGKTFVGRGWTSYTIPRQNGMVIIGGTREANDWYDKPRPETTKIILENAVKYDRNLLPPEKREKGTYLDLELVSEGCGLRPSRKGGFRMEVTDLNAIPLLHHYGHGGSGYQNSWGCARRAVDMLLPALA